MIKINHLSKSYDQGNVVVDDVTFEVESGETLVLLGSSGSGKTTLLKMMNRLVEPTAGSIEIAGKKTLDIDPIKLRRSIGYVFQGIGLFPHLTIQENITIVLNLQGFSEIEQKKMAWELLELVNLNARELADRFPQELSGGQQQRIGVARAIATGSDILLMDEPFGALDPVNRHSLQTELLRLKSTLKKTIVFVTHDIFEALRLADRIAIMHKGRLEQIGNQKNIIHQPATKYITEMFKHTATQLKDYLSFFDD